MPTVSVIMPTVSVIMPAYNSERFIGAAIQSVLHQTYEDLEVIVVDDGSTDNTVAVAESIRDERVRVYKLPHVGCAANYNRCFSHAKGKYFAILDHDDLMLPERLERQIERLDGDSDLMMIGSCYDIIDEDDRVLDRKHMPQGPKLIRRYQAVFNAIQHPTITFRRQLLDLIGMYHEEYYPAHDSEFILRAVQVGKCDNIPLSLTQWRRVKTSPTNAKAAEGIEKHYRVRREYNVDKFIEARNSRVKREYALNLARVAYYRGLGAETFTWCLRTLSRGGWSLPTFRYLFSSLLMPLVRFLRAHNLRFPGLESLKQRKMSWEYFSP
ncbi:MAG: hypothetical protein CL946_02295 [Ectothiorhodospiraceae bacterium]|nr:hypothetical protein [Ectothiorhodospiraceae bacterium]